MASKDILRIRLDAVLALANSDQGFREELVQKPHKTLSMFGLSDKEAEKISVSWGLPSNADCGADTCRLTNPCGWTICGKTTNSCGGEPPWTIFINPAPDQAETKRG